MSTSDKIFDQLLIMKCQLGDNRSLSLLVKRWQPKLFSRILYLTKNEDVSSDILQETWNAIFKNLNKLKDPSRFAGWAYTIANRKSYDWISTVQKERNVFEKDDSIEDDIQETSESEEHIDLLRNAIKSFGQVEQAILTLFYLENYSLKEISKLTKLPVGTVKSKLFYSREKLKSIIKRGVHHV